MINPTGGKIRNDSEGHGYYGASRGARKHAGTDYLANAFQRVVTPIAGKINRIVQVYQNDPQWVGVEIVGRRLTVKLFYVKIDPALVGSNVYAGDAIGIAQAISKRYNQQMSDHVHLEITSIDPECLMGV